MIELCIRPDMRRYFLYNFFLKMPKKIKKILKAVCIRDMYTYIEKYYNFLFRFLISLFLSEILYYYIYLDEDFKN